MSFLSAGWIWLYLGALLMLAELMAPGFVIFFFGLSAATVGVCRFIFGEAFDSTWQLAGFSAFSIVYLLTLRRWMKHIFTGDVETSKCDLGGGLVGRTGEVVAAIVSGREGRVLVGDSEWSATASGDLAVGTAVRVVSQTNLTLMVEAI